MCNVRRGWIGLVLLALGAAPLHAAPPKPDVVPGGWQLDFQYDKMKVIGVRPFMKGETKYYWYLRYKVINRTGLDRMFVPSIRLLTDAGDNMLSNNRDVPPGVFTQIKKKLKNKLLLRPSKMSGKLLQGEDNARESVAIWAVPKHDVDMLRVFVGGLSDESHEMYKVTERGDTPLIPGTFVPEKKLIEANLRIAQLNDRAKGLGGTGKENKPAKAQKQDVLMRKTYMLEFHSPGDQKHVRVKPLMLRKNGWILR